MKHTWHQLPKEQIYQEIMKLGKRLAPFPDAEKTKANLVGGCQSIMHLTSSIRDGKIYFLADCDALISKGLAALLIDFYNGRPPEDVLKVAPRFIEELGIPEILSPSRANGLASLYLKMKQQALSHLVGC